MDIPNTSPVTPEVISTDSESHSVVLEAKPSIHKNASWNAIISIVIILAMVVVGAFYAWGKRISEERAAQLQFSTATSTTN